MNPGLALLKPYPFERLASLTLGAEPPRELRPITLSVGEPKHTTPALIRDALSADLHGLANYPVIRGNDALREAMAVWLRRRFDLPADSLDPNTQVLPVNGTREALFAVAQCVIDTSRHALVLMPNPSYQIYEGAALLAGAQAGYVNCEQSSAFLPNFDAVMEDLWAHCQLLYLCSPGNPTGAVMDEATLQQAIKLAHKHNFVIASDECYAEIYAHEHEPRAG